MNDKHKPKVFCNLTKLLWVLFIVAFILGIYVPWAAVAIGVITAVCCVLWA